MQTIQPTRLGSIGVGVALLVALSGCGSGSSNATPSSQAVSRSVDSSSGSGTDAQAVARETAASQVPASSAAPPGSGVSANPTSPRAPKPSAEAAVVALLEAEQAGNHRASFALLSQSGLATYPNPDVWATHRRGIAPVTGFLTESVVGPAVTLLVDHTPAIDPFLGLQFANERQIWHTQQESDGWLVDPDPEVQPLVPSDVGGREVAATWVAARQSCNEQAATALQAVITPFGVSTAANALCKTTGQLSVGMPAMVDPGPQTAQMVEQYGPGVVRYIRSVEVSGGPEPFTILLVPIGDVWRVIGVND